MNSARLSTLILSRKLAGLAAILAGLSVGFLALPAIAQDTNADPLADLQTDDGGSDLFSGENTSQSDVFNLIHNMILNNGVTMDQYSRQQRETLGTTAEDFRERQRQLLLQQTTEAQPTAGDETGTSN